MLTAYQQLAYSLLPDCQTHYEHTLANLEKCRVGGHARLCFNAQQAVGFALRTLNTTRVAAGLAPEPGPKMLSLDELLAHGRACEAQRVGLTKLAA